MEGNREARSDAVLMVLDDKLPGCSAAVGIDGTVVWSGSRGLANVATGEKLTGATVFDVGSVSKQFTATAVLLLEIDGKLALDDRVSAHLAGLPRWADRVTIEQLIHHSSGIPEYLRLLGNRGVGQSHRLTQAQAVESLHHVPDLHFEPGDFYEYSNSNYLLLAEIVRTVSGKPLPQFLRERVFQPLGLGLVMDPVRKAAGKAASYGIDTQPFIGIWEDHGGRGVLGTVGDLVRWADNYRTGKVGGQRLLDAQVKLEPVKGNAMPGADPGYAYGAGIAVNDDKSLGHDGGSDEFRTQFTVGADRHTAIAVSCNSSMLAPEPLDSMHAELRKIWNLTQ